MLTPRVSIANSTRTSRSALRRCRISCMISENYNTTGETPILARRNYVEVVTRKAKKGEGCQTRTAPL